MYYDQSIERNNMSQSLLNKSAVKACILRHVEHLRKGWDCTQVSAAAIEQIEAKLQNIIREAVKKHPTRGKTFRELQ